MTGIESAGLYVGLFGILFVVLKGTVGYMRVKHKVNLGDGGVDPVYRAIRAQGNAVEDVPIFLIGLVMLAFLDAPIWLIHALGASFLLGRVLHAVGITQVPGLGIGRLIGTIIVVWVKLITALSVLWFVLM